MKTFRLILGLAVLLLVADDISTRYELAQLKQTYSEVTGKQYHPHAWKDLDEAKTNIITTVSTNK